MSKKGNKKSLSTNMEEIKIEKIPKTKKKEPETKETAAQIKKQAEELKIQNAEFLNKFMSTVLKRDLYTIFKKDTPIENYGKDEKYFDFIKDKNDNSEQPDTIADLVKVLTKLQILIENGMISYDLYYPDSEQKLIKLLVVIKENNGIKFTKLYCDTADNIQNHYQDEYYTENIMEEKNLTLFKYPKRISITNDRIHDIFKVVLNLYSKGINELVEYFNEYPDKIDLLKKSLITLKCGSFKNFQQNYVPFIKTHLLFKAKTTKKTTKAGTIKKTTTKTTKKEKLEEVLEAPSLFLNESEFLIEHTETEDNLSEIDEDETGVEQQISDIE